LNDKIKDHKNFDKRNKKRTKLKLVLFLLEKKSKTWYEG